jgi:HEAT repeat protein
MPLPGGASDKAGNRYELFWTTYCVLSVIEEKYDLIRLEPPGDEGKGIEFYLDKDGQRFFYQVKRQNWNSGKWSISDLNSVGVLPAIKKRLLNENSNFVFVSMDPAGELRELVNRSRKAKDFTEFSDIFIQPKIHQSIFLDLFQYLGYSEKEQLFINLKKIDVTSVDESILYELILSKAGLYFNDAEIVVNSLVQLILSGEHEEFTREKILNKLAEKNLTFLGTYKSKNLRFGARDIEQYLFDLMSDLENRKGVASYIELSGESTAYKFKESSRTNFERKWEPEFEVLDNSRQKMVDSTTKKVSSVAISEKSDLANIHDALEIFEKFVIIGTPGAGKSTTLRRLCFENAQNCLSSSILTPLPVYLNLSNWTKDLDIEGFIRENWTFDGDVFLLLENGDINLYLDGLNEMGDSGFLRAKQIKEWINGNYKSEISNLKLKKPKKVICTCRESDYFQSYDLEVSVIRVKELSDIQIHNFSDRYLGEAKTDFLKIIFDLSEKNQPQSTNLLALARNPYLLSALIYLFETSEEKELPKNTGNLFKRLTETLWEREKLRNSLVGFEISDIHIPLARLAFSMIDSGMPTIVPFDYAEFYVEKSEVMKLAQNASYIVVEDNQVRFYHQLMQEYFAAIGLSRVGVSHINIDVQRKSRNSTWSGTENSLNSKWDQVAIAMAGISQNPTLEVAKIAAISPYLAEKCRNSGVFLDNFSILTSLIHALSSSEEVIRRSAARSIGNYPGSDEAVFALIAVLSDSNQGVHDSAVRSLKEIGGSAVDLLVLELLKNNPKTKYVISAVLVHLGKSAVSKIVPLLNYEVESVVVVVIQTLGRIGIPDYLEKIVEMTNNKSLVIVEAAVTALGNIRTTASFSCVYRFLESKIPRIKISAIESIFNLCNKVTSLKVFSEIASNATENLQVRLVSIRLIGKVSDARSVPYLVQLLSDEQLVIHQESYNELERLRRLKISGAGSATRIFRDLRYKDQSRRWSAFSRIKETFGNRGLIYALDKKFRDENIFWELQGYVKNLSEAEVDFIGKIFDSDQQRSFTLLRHLIEMLGNSKIYSAGKYLLQFLESEKVFFVGISIISLGKLRYLPAKSTILNYVEDTRKIYSNSDLTLGQAAKSAIDLMS